MFLITAAIAIVGVLGLAAGLYGLVVSTETSYDSPEDKSKKLKWGRQPRMYVISSCIVLIIAWLSTVVVTVRAGEVGIVTRFGAVTGRELGPGVALKLPALIESVVKFDTRVQKQDADASAASNDLQDVQAKLSVNYHLNRGNVSGLYQKVGDDFEEKLLAPAIQEVFKATTAKFTAQDLIRQRTEVKNEATKALAERLRSYGIIVDSVNLVNFTFGQEFTKAIELSQVAQQQVIKAENDLKRVQVEADQKIAQAKADAESQRQQAQSITAEYLQLKTIEKWNGVYPSTVVGGGTVPLVNLPAK